MNNNKLCGVKYLPYLPKHNPELLDFLVQWHTEHQLCIRWMQILHKMNANFAQPLKSLELRVISILIV